MKNKIKLRMKCWVELIDPRTGEVVERIPAEVITGTNKKQIIKNKGRWEWKMPRIKYIISAWCEATDATTAKQIYNYLRERLTEQKAAGKITQGQVTWNEQTKAESESIMA